MITVTFSLLAAILIALSLLLLTGISIFCYRIGLFDRDNGPIEHFALVMIYGSWWALPTAAGALIYVIIQGLGG